MNPQGAVVEPNGRPLMPGGIEKRLGRPKVVEDQSRGTPWQGAEGRLGDTMLRQGGPTERNGIPGGPQKLSWEPFFRKRATPFTSQFCP